MRRFNVLGAWMTLFALVLSCGKPDPDPTPAPQPDPTPSITIPSSSQSIFSSGMSFQHSGSGSGGAQSSTVQFTASASWSADVSDTKSSTWLSIQPTSGNAGTVSMTVTAQPNTGTAGRSASVTIKCGSASQKFTVTQAGNPVVAVSEVTLNKTELTLEPGTSETLVAAVTPENATDKTVIWSTSNAEVATVSNGVVTAIAEGTADITASAGGKTATCVVSVKKGVVAVTSVTLNKTTLSLIKGQSETLVATVKPDDATDKTVTWSSSDATIASVTQDGLVTALKSGNVVITAKAGEKSATCSVVITTPVESVSLDRNSVSMEEGQSTTLVATINPNDADEKTVTWATSNASVATVSNGVVTAIAEGIANITASAGGKSATCVVSVKKGVVAVTSVTLNKTTLNLTKGQSETLVATVNPSDATDKTVTWSSSDASIASVTQDGLVTALKSGTVTITAKAGEKSATCAVSITTPVESITLSQTTVTLEIDQSLTITATVNPSDATDKTVAWESSNPAVVTVDNGKLTGKSVGNATIFARAGGVMASCIVEVKQKGIGGDDPEGFEDGGEIEW